MKIFNISLLVLLITSILQAQFSTRILLSSGYDDNLYRAPVPSTDLLTNFALQLDYQPANRSVNFNYSGNYFLYRANTDRNFTAHSLGINYSSPFGGNGSHTLYLGASAALRSDDDAYKSYDYTQLYAYANVRLNLHLLFLKGGYNFRYRDYSNWPELSNTRQYIFIQANRSFASRTTLIIEGDLGRKSFAGQEVVLESGTIGAGMGHRSGGNMSTTLTAIGHAPAINQAVLLLRASQSLHERAGLFVQFRRQISLDAGPDVMNSDGFFQDEELFDDPFSYQSTGYSAGLTWLLPWSVKLQTGGLIESKQYTSEQAYEDAADTAAVAGSRGDNVRNVYVTLRKSFVLKKSWMKRLHFNLNYSYIRNKSNSYWYDYRNSVWNAGLECGF